MQICAFQFHIYFWKNLRNLWKFPTIRKPVTQAINVSHFLLISEIFIAKDLPFQFSRVIENIQFLKNKSNLEYFHASGNIQGAKIFFAKNQFQNNHEVQNYLEIIVSKELILFFTTTISSEHPGWNSSKNKNNLRTNWGWDYPTSMIYWQNINNIA